MSGLLCSTATAQVRFSSNISIQPNWGPRGYSHIEYLYLPDFETYYNVPRHEYWYMRGGRWTTSPYLPERFRGYNLYNARKIVVNEPRPYLRHSSYYSRYSPDRRYLEPSYRTNRGVYHDNRAVIHDNRGVYHDNRRAYRYNRAVIHDNRGINHDNREVNRDSRVSRSNDNRYNQGRH
jgi:hypothetical protein